MFCTQCGSMLGELDRFCSACGAEVRRTPLSRGPGPAVVDGSAAGGGVDTAGVGGPGFPPPGAVPFDPVAPAPPPGAVPFEPVAPAPPPGAVPFEPVAPAPPPGAVPFDAQNPTTVMPASGAGGQRDDAAGWGAPLLADGAMVPPPPSFGGSDPAWPVASASAVTDPTMIVPTAVAPAPVPVYPASAAGRVGAGGVGAGGRRVTGGASVLARLLALWVLLTGVATPLLLEYALDNPGRSWLEGLRDATPAFSTVTAWKNFSAIEGWGKVAVIAAAVAVVCALVVLFVRGVSAFRLMCSLGGLALVVHAVAWILPDVRDRVWDVAGVRMADFIRLDVVPVGIAGLAGILLIGCALGARTR